ncbi:MAG: aminopeptidase [Clostridia bacterium]|nr:aminopeptidase [Clostridia bacterium]
MIKASVLKKYARLIATVGGNIKKGQEVMVFAELDCPEFVELVVTECYKAKASKVTVEWTHQPLTKIHTKYRSLSVLSKVEEWEKAKLQHRVDTLPVCIYLISDDPDGLNGINREKHQKGAQARFKVIKPFRDEMDNKYQWCIAAVPGVKWAKKVFPGVRKEQAIEKLWRAILTASRVDPDGNDDPVENWKKHNDDLQRRCDYLNALGLEALEYSSDNGTKLTVGLIPDAIFMGGGETTLKGNFFNANIPSEEIFITPMRGKAEGVVYSTKPFSYRGELIENFNIRFENGKAVEVHAEKGEELLKQMINMDEGASYLGECALVPYSSPINKSGILFYNTLFDENAACHLALGEGFANCIKDFESYTLAQCREKGINESMIHEDFMIGNDTLSIVGVCRGGSRVQIFKDGEWAF